MRRLLIISLFAAILLSACGTAAEEQTVVEGGESTLVTVYRAPT